MAKRETITLYAGILSPPSIESREATVRPKTYGLKRTFGIDFPIFLACRTVVDRAHFGRSGLFGFSESEVADAIVRRAGDQIEAIKMRLDVARSDMIAAHKLRAKIADGVSDG